MECSFGLEEGTQGRQVVSKDKVMDCSLGIERDRRYPAIDPGRNAAVKGACLCGC
jgi:hypothetical protein